MTNELGQKPTQSEMNELGQYSSAMYARFFGSWSTTKQRLDERDSQQATEHEDQEDSPDEPAESDPAEDYNELIDELL